MANVPFHTHPFIIPTADEAAAIAGLSDEIGMTPKSVKQSIASEVGSTIAPFNTSIGDRIITIDIALDKGLVRPASYFGLVSVDQGVTFDQSANMKTALESGYVIDGQRRTYNVSGNVRPVAGSFKGLMNMRVKQLDPNAAGRRTLDIRDQSNFLLENIEVDGGSVFTGPNSYLSNNGLIFINGCSKFRASKLLAEKGGAGNGIAFEGCSDFEVDRLVTRDMRWVLPALTDDAIQGIWFSACSNFSASQLRAMNFDGILAGVASKRFHRGISVSGCSKFSIFQPVVHDVDQGIDITGSAGNRDFVLSGALVSNTASWGIKAANTARRGQIIGCITNTTGLSGFVASPVSPAGQTEADQTGSLKYIGCRAINPGGLADVVSSGNDFYAGFLIETSSLFTATPQGITYTDCEALDDRGGGAQMPHGFVNRTVHPGTVGFERNSLLGQCKSTGHTVAASKGFHVPYVSITGTGTGAVLDSAWTNVDFDAADIDDSCNAHNPASNSDIIRIWESGVYEVIATLTFTANATGIRGARLTRAGTAIDASIQYIAAVPGGTLETVVRSVYTGRFTAGDSLRAQGYQTSGGSLTINRTKSFVTARKVPDIN